MMGLTPAEIEQRPSFNQAMLCLLGIVFLVFFGLFVIKTSLVHMILLCIIWTILHAYYFDQNIIRLKRSLFSAIRKSASVFLFFILIGALIAAFTISGAIPTLIYYGLDFISPLNFLPIGMVLCSLMSLAIGSCWGTIGTMGVALIGVASILQIPLPMAAGMIVSGAYFGDKFSPISDTTILSALTTETDLYKHILGMTYSIIPAYIISLIIFWFIGAHYGAEHALLLNQVVSIQQHIYVHFHIGFITLLPMGVMLILSLKKIPAAVSMLLSVFVALIVAIFVQKIHFTEALNALWIGPNMKTTGSSLMDAVFNHGGIHSMLWSLMLALLILTLGGLLEAYHFITTLFARMVQHLKTPIALVSATITTSVLCNILMGEAYLSIILSSRIFKKSYINMKLDSCVLSKAIEEGSTFSTPLIPWTTSGVFITSTLGVYPLDYLFWSIFNWVAPLMFLLLVSVNFVGIKLYQQKLVVNHPNTEC